MQQSDLIIEWRSDAFDETISLTGFHVSGKDIVIAYCWIDLVPPASTRRNELRLFYKSGPWYEFAFFVTHVVAKLPLSRLHSSTWTVQSQCRKIRQLIAATVASHFPLPRPDALTVRPMPRRFRMQDPDSDSDLDTSSVVATVGLNHNIKWGNCTSAFKHIMGFVYNF